MHTIEIIFAVGWAVFWLYWLIAAFSTKRGRYSWSSAMRVRLVLLILVIALDRAGVFHDHHANTSEWRESLGLALFALGLGFAVWARLNIGRNWGTPMSQKSEPELVTSGPYRLVRHPIYSGILLAGVGTALALNWWWLFVVAIAGAYFVYSAVNEERYMMSSFPDSYPAYRRSSKMFVPYVF